MYVCLCTNVTDTEIIECSKDGCSLSELQTKLCVGQVCGCCKDEVARIYADTLQKQIHTICNNIKI